MASVARFSMLSAVSMLLFSYLLCSAQIATSSPPPSLSLTSFYYQHHLLSLFLIHWEIPSYCSTSLQTPEEFWANYRALGEMRTPFTLICYVFFSVICSISACVHGLFLSYSLETSLKADVFSIYC